MTNTSGCPGRLRSGSTSTRPARSTGAPSVLPSGEAATPAAQSTTVAGSAGFADVDGAWLNLGDDR